MLALFLRNTCVFKMVDSSRAATSCGGSYVCGDTAASRGHAYTPSASNAVSFEMLEDSEVQVTQNRKRKMDEVIKKTMKVTESSVLSHVGLGSGVILQVQLGPMKYTCTMSKSVEIISVYLMTVPIIAKDVKGKHLQLLW